METPPGTANEGGADATGGSASQSPQSNNQASPGGDSDGLHPPGDLDSQSPVLAPESQSKGGRHKHGSHKKAHEEKSDNISLLLIGMVAILVIVVACLVCAMRRTKKRQRKYKDLKHPKGPPMDYVVTMNQGTPDGRWGTTSRPTSGEPSSVFSDIGYSPSPIRMGGQSQFTFEELASATNGFSEANVLGQGGFGYVHKGILPDRRAVAVKSLKAGSGQGEREFQAEVEIISRVHHRHLVSLVGYCMSYDKKMLVYEFVPNNTLEFHLHRKGQPVMDWSTRLRIALGSAKGLAYLHEDCHPRIIHRDIKSANILLDNNFEAMVADFGLAKLNSDNFTHVSTRVMGTFGYLAPEYAASGKLTEKSDVFSFGVMLAEIITGRRPLDPTNRNMEDSLVEWVRPLMAKALEDRDYIQLADPRLGNNYVLQEMTRMVACANAAIRHSARRRPRMSQIVRALDGGSLDDLNETNKAGQGPATAQTTHADIYDTRAYNADLMKFRQMVISDDDDSGSMTTS